MVSLKYYCFQILMLINEILDAESRDWRKVIHEGNFTWTVKDFAPYKSDPPFCEGIKTDIETAVIPLGIPDMKIEKLTLTLDFYIELTWKDCRLTRFLPESDRAELPAEIHKTLWTPSVIISNGINTKPVEIQRDWSTFTTIKLAKLFFSFRIRKDETFYCIYDLFAYPMDIQHCEMNIEIVGEEKNLNLVHSKMKLPSIHDRSPPQFTVKEVGMRDTCNRDDDYSKDKDCVAFYVVLKRELPYYLIVTYFPSALIVILSWVSFWLDVDASAPRVTLGLTSLLTLSTQFASVQKNLPPVSYIKAIDLWMFCCMFMIFCSLIEFALVNYQHREKKKLETKEITEIKTQSTKIPNMNKVYVFNVSPKDSVMKQQPLLNSKMRKKEKIPISNIDKFARIGFPLFFILFNIVYWSYYLSGY